MGLCMKEDDIAKRYISYRPEPGREARRMERQRKEPLHKSFDYAAAGIAAVIKKERNMKIPGSIWIFTYQETWKGY